MNTIGRVTLGCMLVVAGIACSGSDAPPECTVPESTTSVEIADFGYAPGCVEASNGDTLQIANADSAPHTYTVKGSGLDVDLEAGATGSLALEGLDAGTTYAIACTYHSDMTAALKIV